MLILAENNRMVGVLKFVTLRVSYKNCCSLRALLRNTEFSIIRVNQNFLVFSTILNCKIDFFVIGIKIIVTLSEGLFWNKSKHYLE